MKPSQHTGLKEGGPESGRHTGPESNCHSQWGGGKSTILKLIEAEFKDDDTCFVVSTNPWAYDDQV
ncbi:P-loop NTPase fold protein, partial [Mycobacterium kiyosense]|uniref:P-loop NTPase fold protein n=1 Tax=Mycobacterium kiyosense TaxID=2871094 RepID=UPI0035A25A3D